MAKERNKQQQALQDRVVHIARVAKVVKGGRRFSFSALVCVGDGLSQVGFGLGKANEVPDAIRKASDVSKRHLIHVPIVDGTIPFEVIGHSGACRVQMYPAPQGKGIIAGSAARMIFDLCGIKDIVCKIHGSRNHHNVVRATFDGLSQLQSIEDYAVLRQRSPEDVKQNRAVRKKAPAQTQEQTQQSPSPNIVAEAPSQAPSAEEDAAAPDTATAAAAHETAGDSQQPAIVTAPTHTGPAHTDESNSTHQGGDEPSQGNEGKDISTGEKTANAEETLAQAPIDTTTTTAKITQEDTTETATGGKSQPQPQQEDPKKGTGGKTSAPQEPDPEQEQAPAVIAPESVSSDSSAIAEGENPSSTPLPEET